MPPKHIMAIARSIGFERSEAFPYSFEILEMLAGIGPLIETNNEVEDRSAKAYVKRAVASLVVRAFGGRSPNFASAADELTFHRLVGAVMNDFVASGQGGFTILHKAA